MYMARESSRVGAVSTALCMRLLPSQGTQRREKPVNREAQGAQSVLNEQPAVG